MPDAPPAPLVAFDVPVDVEVAAPVLPPVLLSFVVALPVLPVVVSPEAVAEAEPERPPPARPLTLPEFPDTSTIEIPPVPPPYEPELVSPVV